MDVCSAEVCTSHKNNDNDFEMQTYRAFGIGLGWGDARKGTLPPSQMLAEYTKRFKQIERTYYFCLPLQIFRPSYDPDIDGYTALVKRIRKNTL